VVCLDTFVIFRAFCIRGSFKTAFHWHGVVVLYFRRLCILFFTAGYWSGLRGCLGLDGFYW